MKESKLSAFCMHCLVKSQLEKMPKEHTENEKAEFMREVLRTVADSKDWETAPVILSKLIALQEKHFNVAISYKDEKKTFNDLMLSKEKSIEERICKAPDTLKRAIQYARVGNYIDFAALENVEEEKLFKLLTDAENDELDLEEYNHFLFDLKSAKSLALLTDNCGEIVLDKLLVKELNKKYPDLEITAIVRGKPVINDATMEDAKAVGLIDICKVVGNGTSVAGTALRLISDEAKEIIENADVIISKGQGNFETLIGCNLNVYYVFLCKCQWFVTLLGLEQFKGAFINDKRLKFKHK